MPTGVPIRLYHIPSGDHHGLFPDPPAAADVLVAIAPIEERTVARIDVGPAARPVFTNTTSKSGEKRQSFLVRINNSTQELSGQDAHDYQRSRWPV